MQGKIVVRGRWDRLRYVLMFEGLLIAMLAPVLAFSFDRAVTDTGALALVLSLMAMVLNYVYNAIYDRIDVHYGRVPTERKPMGRIIHAVGFESTLVVTTLPVVMWWLSIGWWHALLMDLALMAAIVVYTFVFTWTYDRVFPVPQPAAGSPQASNSEP